MMNIFVLDYNPINAAKMQCDKHIVKMPLESAQILCSAFPKGKAPYKLTHLNHPCSIWARRSTANYKWLIEHGIALCDEYTFRYGKIHKSKDVILWCQKNLDKIKFPSNKKTNFHLCMDEQYHVGNAVQSYREYYIKAKSEIAYWKKARSAPRWFTNSFQ
jgi:hypothetical protein